MRTRLNGKYYVNYLSCVLILIITEHKLLNVVEN